MVMARMLAEDSREGGGQSASDIILGAGGRWSTEVCAPLVCWQPMIILGAGGRWSTEVCAPLVCWQPMITGN